MTKPRVEKVNETTIRVTMERISDIPLARLLLNKEMLLKQSQQITQQFLDQEKSIKQSLKEIDEILAEAEKLGVVAKVKNKKEVK